MEKKKRERGRRKKKKKIWLFPSFTLKFRQMIFFLIFFCMTCHKTRCIYNRSNYLHGDFHIQRIIHTQTCLKPYNNKRKLLLELSFSLPLLLFVSSSHFSVITFFPANKLLPFIRKYLSLSNFFPSFHCIMLPFLYRFLLRFSLFFLFLIPLSHVIWKSGGRKRKRRGERNN